MQSLTTEEAEGIARDKKKVWSDSQGFSGRVSQSPRVEDWMKSTSEEKIQTSYRDSLLAKMKWRDSWFIVDEEGEGE